MSNYVLGNVALGQAMERYHNDAEFHAAVYTAVQVVMGERESSLLAGFRRDGLTVAIATEAAAVALHLADSGCGWCRKPPADRLACTDDPCGRGTYRTPIFAPEADQSGGSVAGGEGAAR